MTIGRTPSVHSVTIIGVATSLTMLGCASYWSSDTPLPVAELNTPTLPQPSAPVALPVTIIADRSQATGPTVPGELADNFGFPHRSPSEFLHLADTGIKALHQNNLAVAQSYFEETSKHMVSMSRGGAGEKSAVSLFGSESAKSFKGEPHEKAVFFLYQGLYYLSQGDYENAAGSFHSGAIFDAMALDSTDRSDWLSLDLLLLQAYLRMNHSSVSEWKDYIRLRYGQEELPLNWDHDQCADAIILVVAGLPPEKLAGDRRGETLTYVERRSRIHRMVITDGNSGLRISLAPSDDCHVQAVTRGKRGMDSVLASKARKKGVVEGVGALAAGAAPLTGGVAPLALGLAKELSWNVSDKIDSKADMRQMRMLPGRLFLYFAHIEGSSTDLTIELVDVEGRPLATNCCRLSKVTDRPLVALAKCPM